MSSNALPGLSQPAGGHAGPSSVPTTAAPAAPMVEEDDMTPKERRYNEAFSGKGRGLLVGNIYIYIYIYI